MVHRVWAQISLANLRHNYNVLRSRLPAGVKMMAIVKADAYGHGIAPIAHELVRMGVDDLGVAYYDEAEALRDSGHHGSILILGYTPESLAGNVVRLNLTQSVFDLEGGLILARHAEKLRRKAAIHIKVDTGMGRLGFVPTNAAIDDILLLAENPNLDIRGIYTHCATSDEIDTSFLREQQEMFGWFLGQLAIRRLHIPIKHMANSGCLAQIAADAEYENLLFDMVRAGVLLYGLPPSAMVTEYCECLGLLPVMRAFSYITMLRDTPAGTGISYNHTYTTTRPSRIAVLPMGYADGYPRVLSNQAGVLVCGKPAPIVGSICMDQMMVDVTDIPEAGPNTPVVVLGNASEGVGACDLAKKMGTISYEIMTDLGTRVHRVYVG